MWMWMWVCYVWVGCECSLIYFFEFAQGRQNPSAPSFLRATSDELLESFLEKPTTTTSHSSHPPHIYDNHTHNNRGSHFPSSSRHTRSSRTEQPLQPTSTSGNMKCSI
jgi:hypothetical protein